MQLYLSSYKLGNSFFNLLGCLRNKNNIKHEKTINRYINILKNFDLVFILYKKITITPLNIYIIKWYLYILINAYIYDYKHFLFLN